MNWALKNVAGLQCWTLNTAQSGSYFISGEKSWYSTAHGFNHSGLYNRITLLCINNDYKQRLRQPPNSPPPRQPPTHRAVYWVFTFHGHGKSRESRQFHNSPGWVKWGRWLLWHSLDPVLLNAMLKCDSHKVSPYSWSTVIGCYGWFLYSIMIGLSCSCARNRWRVCPSSVIH